MKKQLLTLLFLTAALLCAGVSNAWADTTIGNTSTGWGSSGSSTSAYTLATGNTLTFTFTVDASAGTYDYQGYVAILAKSDANTWGDNQYLFLRSACDYIIGAYDNGVTWNTGALYNTNTYGSTSKVGFFVGATVTMAIKRVGTNVLVTTAITKDATTYYHYYQQNLGTTDDIYAFLAADAAQLTITGDAITSNGLTEEAYDFYSNRPSAHVTCTTTGYVNVNSTSSNIIANTQIEMNDRFAAQFGSGSWMMHKDNALYSANNGGRRFGILNLKAGDRVAVTFPDGYALTFSGTPNAYIGVDGDISDGTSLVSGMYYTVKADGMIALQAPNYGRIYTITIFTSAPVLTKPTITFDSMVENESDGLYYPKVTFTSDDGVTFYDSDGNDITNGYTFTAAGTLNVYATKSGRTNSAVTTYTVDNGWILANSVVTGDWMGAINYADGTVLSGTGTLTSPTWVVPGLTFGGTYWYYKNDYMGPNNGARTLSCTVLNENRVATIKHYHYSTNAASWDYLTLSSSSVSFARNSSSEYDHFLGYDLYCSPSETVSVTIGSTGYSTFSSPVPLDFSGVSGLKAYVATAVASGKVSLTSVTSAPANTGLVLEGTAGETYNIPVTASAETPASNMLVGCIVETTVAADATSKFNNYVLVNEDGTAKFQSLVENGATIPAGKAFLKSGAYSSGSGDTRKLSIVFDDDNTTGIEDAVRLIDNGQLTIENSQVYDLQGRRVAQPSKGLYIVNGIKVVVK